MTFALICEPCSNYNQPEKLDCKTNNSTHDILKKKLTVFRRSAINYSRKPYVSSSKMLNNFKATRTWMEIKYLSCPKTF